MDKALLRKDFLLKRTGLTQEEASIKNDHILTNFLDSLKLLLFETVHIFLPQIGKNEVNTWKIIPELRASFPHVQVVVPYIIPGTREMQHYLLNSQTVLVQNQWKIPEPDPLTSQPIEPESIDIIIVPLLAFDTEGYRVGYGGGYYDRFLKQCRPDAIKIGLSFFEPVEKIADKHPFDVPVDICITPDKIYRFTA